MLTTEIKLILFNKIRYNQEKKKEPEEYFDRMIQLLTNGFKSSTKIPTTEHFPSSLFNDTKDLHLAVFGEFFGVVFMFVL